MKRNDAKADEAARRAVDSIMKDLESRRGLKQEWAGIDADIRREIRERWTALILEAQVDSAVTEEMERLRAEPAPAPGLREAVAPFAAMAVRVADVEELHRADDKRSVHTICDDGGRFAELTVGDYRRLRVAYEAANGPESAEPTMVSPSPWLLAAARPVVEYIRHALEARGKEAPRPFPAREARTFLAAYDASASEPSVVAPALFAAVEVLEGLHATLTEKVLPEQAVGVRRAISELRQLREPEVPGDVTRDVKLVAQVLANHGLEDDGEPVEAFQRLAQSTSLLLHLEKAAQRAGFASLATCLSEAAAMKRQAPKPRTLADVLAELEALLAEQPLAERTVRVTRDALAVRQVLADHGLEDGAMQMESFRRLAGAAALFVLATKEAKAAGFDGPSEAITQAAAMKRQVPELLARRRAMEALRPWAQDRLSSFHDESGDELLLEKSFPNGFPLLKLGHLRDFVADFDGLLPGITHYAVGLGPPTTFGTERGRGHAQLQFSDGTNLFMTPSRHVVLPPEAEWPTFFTRLEERAEGLVGVKDDAHILLRPPGTRGGS